MYHLHEMVNAARTPWIAENCRSGALGCVQCKGELAEKLNEYLRPLRLRRASYDDETIRTIVRDGSAKARIVANQTLSDVKAALRLGL